VPVVVIQTVLVAAEKAPNPILPVGREILWGFGSFIVLFLLMRYWLFPKVRKGMSARDAVVRTNLDTAETVREAAAADEIRYEAGIAAARSEANTLLEAARSDVDADRTAKVAAANARIAERRAAAAAQTEAAKQAALAHVEEAVLDVATTAAQRVLATKVVDAEMARRAVADVIRAEAVS
jgi:F-type H+-transporting ATPase subunit b